MFLEAKTSPPGALDAQWRRFEVTLRITKAGGTLNVFFGANDAPDDCFLVDDVVARRIE